MTRSCFCTQLHGPELPVEEETPISNFLRKVVKYNKGHISPWEMDEAKKMLKSEPALTSHDAMLLLEMCGSKLPNAPKSERTAAALTFWKHFKERRLRIDTGMCNALLRAHIDNWHSYSPKVFLAWMQSAGIEADEETFSLFIRRYCGDGDMGEATATLSVMQARGMSISRLVFNSLVGCYAANGEVEEANRVIEVMRNSGIKVLGDTHAALVEGLVRSGRKWEDVRVVLVDLLNTPGLRIESKEMFDIFMALVRSKDHAAAKDMLTIIESQPKEKRYDGYYWIVRGVIPQAIFEGAPELALDLYATVDVPKYRKKQSANVFHALIAVEAKPDLIVKLIQRSLIDVSPEIAVSENNRGALRVMEACIEMGKLKYAQDLSVVLRQKLDIRMLGKPNRFSDFFIRRNMERIADPVEQILFIMAANSVGIRPTVKALANDVVPKLFAAHQEEGDDSIYLLAILSDTLNSVSSMRTSWAQVANALVQFLLNKETSAGFDEALRFIFGERFHLWPVEWHASLARAYLATGNADGFADVILKTVISQGREDGMKRKDKPGMAERSHVNAFKSLLYIHMNAHMYRPSEDPDRVLLSALKALQKARVGLPKEYAEGLRSTVRDPETLQTLQNLQEMESAMHDYWTRPRVAALDEKLAQKYAKSKESGFRVSDKSLAKLEKLQRRLREVGHEQW